MFREGRRGNRLRPFCEKAGVNPGGWSRLLERALTDFGAEESFTRAAQRVKEHYGIEVSASAIRGVTYKHARKIQEVEPARRPAANTIVTEVDGSMIPLMKPGENKDHRKDKSVFWSEVRLCCARGHDEATRIYGATLGSLENISLLWRQTAEWAGLHPKTNVHGIGDGAPWILEKFNENFGTQGRYLIDFYHVSEYVGAAAAPVAGAKRATAWMAKQKQRLLEGAAKKVLRALEGHREPLGHVETPVQDAHRYIQQRLEHLHYHKALKVGLPIGSGEVESGHRHVIQQRLKLAGAWWKVTNAQPMIALRVARANNCWSAYWSTN